MKNKKGKLLFSIIVILLSLCGCHSEKNENIDDAIDLEPTEEKHEVVIRAVDEGYDIYPLPSGNGYRYGPSIMYYDDGSLDVWYAREGNNYNEWDYICYLHSDDGGVSWTKEKTVLKPTPGSLDHYSVCDPAAIFFNGYYYLGYTSAASAVNGGINNSCFVARSENPDGPFEKWNGEGWGGNPYPIVEFNGNPDEWGAGELSFVVRDETLFIYYSVNSINGNFTEIATSDLSEDWPKRMIFQDVFGHEKGEDSFDVAYIEETDSFMGVSVVFRFTEASSISVYNSLDGIHFEPVDIIDRNFHRYAHNIGISKTKDGHIDKTDNLFISYAYGYDNYSMWGKWATRFQKVKLVVNK